MGTAKPLCSHDAAATNLTSDEVRFSGATPCNSAAPAWQKRYILRNCGVFAIITASHENVAS
jgi:hypothetical protein